MDLGLVHSNGCKIGTVESLTKPVNTSPFTLPSTRTTSSTPLIDIAVMAEYLVPNWYIINRRKFA